MKKPLAIALILVILFMPFIVYGFKSVRSDESSSTNNSPSSLTDVGWQLISARETDMLLPEDNFNKFVLTLNSDGTYSNNTDCNDIWGDYTLSGSNGIKFEPGATTMMYCEGSLESIYSNLLYKVNTYSVNNNQLTLYLPNNSGELVYTKANQ